MATASHEAPAAKASPLGSLSLRLRLTLWIAAIALVIHLTLTVVILLYHRVTVQGYMDSRYQPRILALVAELRSSDFNLDQATWNAAAAANLQNPLREPYLASVYRLVTPARAELVVSTSNSPEPGETVIKWIGLRETSTVRRTPTGSELEHSLPHARTFVQRLFDSGGREYLLAVTVSDSPASSMLAVLTSVLIMTIPAGVLASGVAGYLISGLIIRPIRQLRHLAGAMSPEQLDRPVAMGATVPELASLMDELGESRRRLRAALVGQDRFISNVSHELKTPVAVILTEAQTIDRTGLTQEQNRFVTSVTDEMRRLGRMVESFLTLTRVRAGKAIAHAERCELNEVIMRSIETCASMARQASITIEPSLLDLPDAAIQGDAELLRIMLDNLIRNAIRFSPQEGKIIVALDTDRENWLIRVRDEGPGVAPELMSRIFDRYNQSSPEISRGRGFGLGLSIAQGIAELHAGTISVSNLGPGCEFCVQFPRFAQLTIESDLEGSESRGGVASESRMRGESQDPPTPLATERSRAPSEPAGIRG